MITTSPIFETRAFVGLNIIIPRSPMQRGLADAAGGWCDHEDDGIFTFFDPAAAAEAMIEATEDISPFTGDVGSLLARAVQQGAQQVHLCFVS